MNYVVELRDDGKVLSSTAEPGGGLIIPGATDPISGHRQEIELRASGPSGCAEPSFDAATSVTDSCAWRHWEQFGICARFLVDEEDQRRRIDGPCSPWVFPDPGWAGGVWASLSVEQS